MEVAVAVAGWVGVGDGVDVAVGVPVGVGIRVGSEVAWMAVAVGVGAATVAGIGVAVDVGVGIRVGTGVVGMAVAVGVGLTTVVGLGVAVGASVHPAKVARARTAMGRNLRDSSIVILFSQILRYHGSGMPAVYRYPLRVASSISAGECSLPFMASTGSFCPHQKPQWSLESASDLHYLPLLLFRHGVHLSDIDIRHLLKLVLATLAFVLG